MRWKHKKKATDKWEQAIHLADLIQIERNTDNLAVSMYSKD